MKKSIYETAAEKGRIMQMEPENGFENDASPEKGWLIARSVWNWYSCDYRPAADVGWEIVEYRQVKKGENYIGASGRTEMWLGTFEDVSPQKYWIVRKVEPEKSTEIVECEVCRGNLGAAFFGDPLHNHAMQLSSAAGLLNDRGESIFRGYRVKKVREREKISRTDGTLLDAGVALTDDGRCTDSLEWIAATGHRVTHVCLEVEK